MKISLVKIAIVFLMISTTSIKLFANESDSQFKVIEWTELMPESDLAALLDRPSYINNVQDGSAQDSIESFQQMEAQDEKTKRFQAALVSLKVVDSFDGAKIKIPGYIVPLEQNDRQEVTEFFIVPYFGACLHMPPPPPNQMIHASYPEGIELESLFNPFWFTGEVAIETIDNAMGTSAYTLKLADITLYEE